MAAEGLASGRAAQADLDGDGIPEVVILATDPHWCGSGGCTLFVLARAGDRPRTVSRSTISRAPIRMLATRTGGWRDLVVGIGGGGLAAGEVVLRWTGDGYPLNPSLAPRLSGRPASTLLIDGTTPVLTPPPAPPPPAPPPAAGP